MTTFKDAKLFVAIVWLEPITVHVKSCIKCSVVINYQVLPEARADISLKVHIIAVTGNVCDQATQSKLFIPSNVYNI